MSSSLYRILEINVGLTFYLATQKKDSTFKTLLLSIQPKTIPFLLKHFSLHNPKQHYPTSVLIRLMLPNDDSARRAVLLLRLFKKDRLGVDILYHLNEWFQRILCDYKYFPLYMHLVTFFLIISNSN